MRNVLVSLLLSVCTMSLAHASGSGENVTGQASAPARVAKIGGSNAKIFDSWDTELALGDCKARKAKLTLYENGSLEWDVELMSIDVDDEWEQSFDFSDGPSGEPLLGNLASGRFNIKVKNKWRTWHWGGSSSPDSKLGEMFQRIQVVRWNGSC